MPDIPYYFFFNALLLLLTLMNVYWFLVSPALPAILRPMGLCAGAKGLWQSQGFTGAFSFPQYIVAFAAKVLTGQMRELEDLREYDSLEAPTAKPCKAQ